MNKEEIMEKLKASAEANLIPAGKAMVKEMVNDILVVALKEVVADSENPYDDMLLAALLPVIEAKLAELLA